MAAKWTVEAVLEELEETLPDASTDNSTSILFDNSLEDGSLPDASIEVLSERETVVESSSGEDSDSSLPDASLELDISVDPTVVDSEWRKECSMTDRDADHGCTTSRSTSSLKNSRNKHHSPRLLPVHSSTPVKSSSNHASIGSSDVSSSDTLLSPKDCSNSSALSEDDVQDMLKLQAWKLTSIIQFKGCADKCAKQAHGLNEYEILSAHSQIASLTNHEKNVWLLNYFSLQCPRNGNGEKDVKKIAYVIHGKEVCFDLWIEILSLNTSRYYRVRKEFLMNDGVNYTVKQNRQHQPKTMKAIAWMDSYFQRVGDKRPDKDWIYLPTCLTKSKLYEMMIEELFQEEVKGISYAKFCQIFNEDFKNVSIPKQCRFTKCDLCTLIKAELIKPRSDSEKSEKQALRKLLDDHLSLQEQERARYYKNRQLATEKPTEFLSLIVDGMDQNKTNIPSLVRMTKSCQNLWTLRTHLTGVLVHGTGSFCYYDYLQWPHDCNLTIFAMLKTLSELSKHRTLPPKLLIQVDNCVRENKNKYVFGFLAVLIELDIFKEIELGFLMVGHTHEDVDQHFSCLSRYLRKHSAITIEDMIQATKASNHAVSSVQVLSYLFNIREWISPHLEQIRYHTEPHIFRFVKDHKGQSVMYYKAWSHENWEPSNDGLILLKSKPCGKPNLLEPSLEKQDINQMIKDLPKYQQTGLIPSDAGDKWDSLLSRFSADYGTIPSPEPEWLLTNFKTVDERITGDLTTPILPDAVLRLSQAAKQTRKIEVGKKSSRRCPGTSTPSKRTCTSTSTSSDTTHTPTSNNTNPIPVVGSFAAVCCSKYKDYIPQIGKVQSFDESTIVMEWLDGTYTSTWIFWKERGKIITETLPLRALLHSPIVFTRSMRLKSADVTFLKKKYETAEYV